MFLQDAFLKGSATVKEFWEVLHAISSLLTCVVLQDHYNISLLDPAVRKYRGCQKKV